MPRYFTLAEARQHLPAVGSAIREAMDAKQVLDAAEKEQQATVEKIMYSGGLAVNHDAAIQVRARREACALTLKRVVERFEEIGCLVKDLAIGLIDFPALYRGKEVYLCWKVDEPDIVYWHPVEEGFAGRRPIDPEFIRECGGS